MKFICPLIVVEDMKRSRYLYETLLKQRVKDDFGENVSFEGGFAIHEKAHFSGLIQNRPMTFGSNTFELYFEEDDLDAVEKLLKLNGYEFVHEMMEQPWKQRVLRFYDEDRHIIEIGERLEHTAVRLFVEGYTMEEICRVTYLSETVVLNEIKAYKENSHV